VIVCFSTFSVIRDLRHYLYLSSVIQKVIVTLLEDNGSFEK
jgi:hypothetical protein